MRVKTGMFMAIVFLLVTLSKTGPLVDSLKSRLAASAPSHKLVSGQTCYTVSGCRVGNNCCWDCPRGYTDAKPPKCK